MFNPPTSPSYFGKGKSMLYRAMRIYHYWRQNDNNISATARQLNIDRKTVKRGINIIENDSQIITQLGRPPKLSVAAKLHIVMLTREFPEQSGNQIAEAINNLFQVKVTGRLINNFRAKFGFWYGPKVTAIELTDLHLQKRIEFASNHLQLGTDWHRVIFSDESWFEKDRNFHYVWRERGVITPQITAPKNAHPKRVLIWGAIGYNYKSKLIILKTTVNSSVYFEEIIRSSGLKNELDELFGSHNWLLQQDNAPPHVSRQTMANFASDEIDVLPDWPPRSPDLNIIEIVWAIMKKRIEKQGPKSMEDLIPIVRAVWDALSNETINALIDSIPKRLNKVIENGGGQIHYMTQPKILTQTEIVDRIKKI
jgi:hypothetical protein